jgi:hypothetical protein
MRIFTRAEFMELPEGVIFAKGKPWFFEDLCVKGETIVHEGKAIDFFARGLQWVSAFDSGEATRRLDDMLENGASYPLEDAEGRDGCFDKDDLFLVYEAADLKDMADMFTAAAAIPLPK